MVGVKGTGVGWAAPAHRDVTADFPRGHGVPTLRVLDGGSDLSYLGQQISTWHLPSPQPSPGGRGSITRGDGALQPLYLGLQLLFGMDGGVAAAQGQEFLVTALLRDAPLFHHDDPVAAA
jgi:hypothetical protein